MLVELCAGNPNYLSMGTHVKVIIPWDDWYCNPLGDRLSPIVTRTVLRSFVMRTTLESFCNENCLRVLLYENFLRVLCRADWLQVICNEIYRMRGSAPDGSSPRGYVRFVESDVGYEL